MRLIDADALKQTFCAECDHSIKCEDCDIDYHFEHLAPTIDPVKHGHWIEVQRLHEKDHTAICECSLCGDTVWVYDGQRAWNYCPCCGAKMEVRE